MSEYYFDGQGGFMIDPTHSVNKDTIVYLKKELDEARATIEKQKAAIAEAVEMREKDTVELDRRCSEYRAKLCREIDATEMWKTKHDELLAILDECEKALRGCRVGCSTETKEDLEMRISQDANKVLTRIKSWRDGR